METLLKKWVSVICYLTSSWVFLPSSSVKLWWNMMELLTFCVCKLIIQYTVFLPVLLIYLHIAIWVPYDIVASYIACVYFCQTPSMWSSAVTFGLGAPFFSAESPGLWGQELMSAWPSEECEGWWLPESSLPSLLSDSLTTQAWTSSFSGPSPQPHCQESGCWQHYFPTEQ